jgi:hypothetical protein
MKISEAASFNYLEQLSDQRGLFEHAVGTKRIEEFGYCTDDNARLLLVSTRVAGSDIAHDLDRRALDFVLAAQDLYGRSHNRMDCTGEWLDKPSTDDCWGRSIWALGVAATEHNDPAVRYRAFRGFYSGIRQRSRWPRAMAFAALGAAEVLADDPDLTSARALLFDAVDVIGGVPTGSWKWPEPRLTYANAALAETLIASGTALNHPDSVEQGLAMLTWLLELETLPGHLSVTSVQGRGPDDRGPRFDQQPIEVAAMADACWRAHLVTGDSSWLRGLEATQGWFMGDNDAGLPMYDDVSGGSFDGLHPHSVNLNQGAESTLALVSTLQRANSLVSVS